MAEINNNMYPQYQYPQQFGAHNVALKGLEDYRPSNNPLVGVVKDSIEKPSNPVTSISSFILGLLTCIGAVRVTNKLMQPKEITDAMTQYDTYTNSRLYRAGEKVANFTPIKKVSGAVKTAGGWLSKITPDFIKEIWQKFKIGSKPTWKGGAFVSGKSSEAMTEFLDYLSQAEENSLKNALGETNNKIVTRALKLYKEGRLGEEEAFKKIEAIMRNANAKKLESVKFVFKGGNIFKRTWFHVRNGLSKVFGTPKNLNLSLAKAQTFQGAGRGVIRNLVSKPAALLGEATGGGVLGGPVFLIMNAFFLAENFKKAMEAEKGEKFKTFMDEFAGTTLGGYLLPMYAGILLNKSLGAAELGMNPKSKGMTRICRLLKLKEEPKTMLEIIQAYDRLIPKNKELGKVIEQFAAGKMTEQEVFNFINKNGLANMKCGELNQILSSIKSGKDGKLIMDGVTPERALKILQKRYGITPVDSSPKAIQDAITQHISGMKSEMQNIMKKEFIPMDKMVLMRKRILKSCKSDITLKSIFKRKPGSGFFSSIGQYLNNAGKYVTQKPLAWIMKKLSFGRYTPLKANGNFIGNLFRKFKRGGGGIFRIFLVMGVLGPMFSDKCQAGVHKIFGKPKAKILEEEREKQEAEQARLAEERANNPNAAQTSQEYVPFSNQQKNLIEMYTGKKMTEASNNGDKATYVPNQKLDKSKGNENDTAVYIPNQMLTQESFVDPNVTQDLLARRDAAVLRADATEKSFNELMSKI